ncbi:NitT/TauT family transport system substrate-binding protein [Micromonospora pallida]|uniref:NitT/TauT family transport system substrate-binding protein n=1 Tax=Micromonospora pallida TaxID=145854 RepID=A0A1C6RV06_9ACTN|nr:ABC transporter substrate-binding protein [Micromonospora pallida]SCL20889.1 NitT/TauT family transport system substrate-binding protein [Micromonospora pallida]
MKQKWGLLPAALVAAVALAGCGGSGGESSAKEGAPAELTFAIASAVIGPKEEVAMFAVAKELGYFAEEKLTVETINTDGSVAALQAVATGSADVTAADSGSILGAVEKNVPVKAIGGLVQNWPWVMAVKPDSTISGGADLRGKKIGVISLASGSAPYARAYVAAAGLDPAKDVELLPVGVGAQAAAALNDGQVDVLALYTQAYAVIENAGTTLKYLDNPDTFDGIRSLSFAVGARSLDDNKDVYTRFLRAAYKAMLFSANNPEAAMRIGYQVFPQILAGKQAAEQLPNDVRSLEAWLKTATPASGDPKDFADWGAIDDQEWAKTQAYTREAGQITGEVALADLWEPGLLAGANQFDKAAVLDKAANYTK